MKKVAFNLLRYGVSIGLLGYLIHLADIDKILQALRQADPGWMALALLVFSVSVFLFSRRWQVLLAGVGIRVPYGSLLRYYLIGYFFNNFLPTTIGGDISRAYNLAQHTDKKADSIASVLMERILGLLATLSLAAIALVLVIDRFSSEAGGYLSFVILFFLTAGLFAVAALLNPWFYQRISAIINRVTWMGIGEKVQQLLEAFQIYRHSKVAVLNGFLLSLACQLLLVGMNYCLAKSLSLPVDFSYLMLVVPATFAIGLLPSINGLGVRDLGYERLLSQIGISSAGALSLSFLNTILPLTASIAGGICLLFQRKSSARAKEAISSESSLD